MSERLQLQPSTPEASAAVAQSHGDVALGEAPPAQDIAYPGEGSLYRVGPSVGRAVHAQPYERKSSDPIYRPLWIFCLDPSVSRFDGSVALVNVPYEPLEPGPTGRLFKVDNYDGGQKLHYRQVNLDDPVTLIRNGRQPSPSDPQFHQQMVYAVCSLTYAAFKSALGRHIAWGIDTQNGDGSPARLLVRPHACNEQNAYYDKTRGELCFGYYRAKERVVGRNLPGSFVFTCLSHDIIAHEVTHALLDGLRTHFAIPSGRDVLAFHEAFADLVAIFQHFSYEKVLQSAIQKCRGQLEDANLLTDLARQFGHTTGSDQPLRTAIDLNGPSQSLKKYHEVGTEPHALGSVLVSAVFEAFITVFKRKAARYLRLATNGSGVLPPGELLPDLQAILADLASKLASQFLTICIRAIDYCPPVNLEFGEFLRAVITADYDLVPDDPWGYREAWIDACQRRGIYPSDVSSLSEDALLWQPSIRPIPEIKNLSFAQLRFEGDPGRPAGAKELQRQACTLGQIISQPEHLPVFGLIHPSDPRLGRDTVELPCVESIRSSRRVGPDGQIVFDLIAEVTQRRIVRDRNRHEVFDYYGGATVILDPQGRIRYVISKSVADQKRLERQREFMVSDAGRRFWLARDGNYIPQSQLFKLLHETAAPS